MSSAWYSCKGCVGSDPTQDTVKIDLKLMLPENPNKENTMPQQSVWNPKAERETAQKAKKLVEEARKQVEDELRHKEDLAAAARAEDQRWAKEQLEEKARKEAESRAITENEEKMSREQTAAAAAAAASAAAAAATAAAEEESRQQEMQKAAALEEARQELLLHEAETRSRQLAAAVKKVSEWCKSNGYQDMNIQKKTFRGATKFPLHTAAKHNNEDMIAMLLMCGVDKYALDSKKQTAHEVATKMNKKGSNEMILARLR